MTHLVAKPPGGHWHTDSPVLHQEAPDTCRKSSAAVQKGKDLAFHLCSRSTSPKEFHLCSFFFAEEKSLTFQADPEVALQLRMTLDL